MNAAPSSSRRYTFLDMALESSIIWAIATIDLQCQHAPGDMQAPDPR